MSNSDREMGKEKNSRGRTSEQAVEKKWKKERGRRECDSANERDRERERGGEGERGRERATKESLTMSSRKP